MEENNMLRKLFNVTLILVMLLGRIAVSPAWSSPDVGDEDGATGATMPDIERQSTPIRHPKNTDYPNSIDYQRLELRQQLLEAGKTAEAAALAQTGEDRVLVLLVEFTGTDVFTWTEGTSTWDPLGVVDSSEWTGTAGDCSNIITATQTFTYTGLLHNEIPQPLSDGRSIWTEDFNTEWFEDFMFGNGVVISYTTQNGTPIQENFIGKSVKDYYSDFSSVTYTITGDVVGWLPIDHSTWYYGADSCPGAISHNGDGVSNNGAIPEAGNNRQLVKDALDAVNAKITAGQLPGFSWKDYDQNGDGIIDRLWVVHSGYGEEEGSSLNLVNYGEGSLWSHSSAITPNYDVGEGIKSGPYIMMPENGGIGVFAHEYGHNLGADDLYTYGYGETSAGFWTIMADDWVGYPLGYQPPSPDPWHLDRWGWLDPMVITDTSKAYEFYLGQPSEFPGGEDTYRGAKIELPLGEVPLPVEVWQGDHYWFSGKQYLANGMMTTQQAIQVPAGAISPTLSFDLVYDIEDYWDFLWVQMSTDAGQNWTTLTNENTICDHDSSWIGGLYGFPDDLCAAGMGGFTTYNASWPDSEAQTFDLGDVAGKSVLLRFWYMTDWGTTYTGAFIDNVKVGAGEDVYFSDDGEADRISGPTRSFSSIQMGCSRSPRTSICSGATSVKMAAMTAAWATRASASDRRIPVCWSGITTTTTPTTKSFHT
jgi:M6 family metalloprotease-like protein